MCDASKHTVLKLARQTKREGTATTNEVKRIVSVYITCITFFYFLITLRLHTSETEWNANIAKAGKSAWSLSTCQLHCRAARGVFKRNKQWNQWCNLQTVFISAWLQFWICKHAVQQKKAEQSMLKASFADS